jgi:hypothetical protein
LLNVLKEKKEANQSTERSKRICAGL